MNISEKIRIEITFLKNSYIKNNSIAYRGRVTTPVAKKLLLSNESVIIGGTVYFFDIRYIGLGICEIKLNKQGSTRMVKKFSDL